MHGVWAASRAYADHGRWIAGVVRRNVLVSMGVRTMCQVGNNRACSSRAGLSGGARDRNVSVVGRHILHSDSVVTLSQIADRGATVHSAVLCALTQDIDLTHVAGEVLIGEGRVGAVRARAVVARAVRFVGHTGVGDIHILLRVTLQKEGSIDFNVAYVRCQILNSYITSRLRSIGHMRICKCCCLLAK